jgi:hypothetical protein
MNDKDFLVDSHRSTRISQMETKTLETKILIFTAGYWWKFPGLKPKDQGDEKLQIVWTYNYYWKCVFYFVAGWSSSFKLLQSQLQAKKANLMQVKVLLWLVITVSYTGINLTW